MKTTQMKTLSLLMLFAALLMIQSGCSKDDEDKSGTANFNVFLKSTPAAEKSSVAYESVMLDIQKVYIHTSSDSAETTGWFELDTQAGIYDLLKDTPGIDTLLAFDSVLQVQTVSQIRLVLGPDNSVTKEGVNHDLITPSGQSSGIKVQVHAELQADKSYKAVLNFKVNKSVLETGNGTFKLKPVIDASVVED